jgi:hypothetical protein
LKAFTIFLLLLNFSWNCSAQDFKLLIIGRNISETKTIDSLEYNSNHKNIKSINEEISNLSQKLSNIGFTEAKLLENTKTQDSSYTAKLTLGKRIKSIHIYIGNTSEFKDLIPSEKKTDTIIIPYEETEAFLNNTLQKLEKQGFALTRLRLINIKKKNSTLFADLKFESEKQRKLNAIIIKFSPNNNTNFPKGHLIQINRKYKNKTFNQNIIQQIHDDFNKFGFVNQIKYPEILFTKDTTKLYVYLEKKKSNTFDGFVGFSNNENKKIAFNGYLDLNLENTLGTGEQFSLYWKSDGNKQKTFKTSLELPYLFKSPIGLKAQIHIFKQDSTFQNTKTAIDLGYFFNHNTRIYLGYQSTESSDIQNTNNSQLSDYKNSFLTSSFEYSKNDTNNFMFPKKTTTSFTIGYGKRNTSNTLETATSSNQFFLNFQAMHNFYLNKKNSINIKSQNYYLQSGTYIINELFRFGGIHSIRGFEENSLQAHYLTSILTEYRYIVSANLYIHSIIDYGSYQDKTNTKKNSTKTSLIGAGLGLGLQTKSGLLQLVLVNGSTKNQKTEFYNTIIQFCYNVKF